MWAGPGRTSRVSILQRGQGEQKDGTPTTLRLSFGSKEQACWKEQARPKACQGTGAPPEAGPEALGWGGLGAASAESSSLGLSAQLDLQHTLHEALSQ